MKYLTILKGIPGPTVRIVGTDVVQRFVAANYTLNGVPANSLHISFEDNDIRYAYGVNPTQGVAGVGHLVVDGEERDLYNGRQIREFRFINAVALTVGVLQITPYYEIGT